MSETCQTYTFLLDLSIFQLFKKCLYFSVKFKEISCFALAYLNLTYLDLKIYQRDRQVLLTVHFIQSNH